MINSYKTDTILLVGMRVKTNSKHFTKAFQQKYDKQSFAWVIKYFSVATALCSIAMQNIQIL